MRLVTFGPFTRRVKDGPEYTVCGDAIQFYPSLMGEDEMLEFVRIVSEWSGLGREADYKVVPGLNQALHTVEGSFSVPPAGAGRATEVVVRSGDWVVSSDENLLVLSDSDFWGNLIPDPVAYMLGEGYALSEGDDDESGDEDSF